MNGHTLGGLRAAILEIELKAGDRIEMVFDMKPETAVRLPEPIKPRKSWERFSEAPRSAKRRLKSQKGKY